MARYSRAQSIFLQWLTTRVQQRHCHIKRLEQRRQIGFLCVYPLNESLHGLVKRRIRDHREQNGLGARSSVVRPLKQGSTDVAPFFDELCFALRRRSDARGERWSVGPLLREFHKLHGAVLPLHRVWRRP